MNRWQIIWLAILVTLVALTKLTVSQINSKVYVWVEDDDDACSHDFQCQNGKWGHHSRCNQQTAKCECHDQDWSIRETVRSKDGVCVIRKRVGDPCNSHEECESIPGEAYCQYGHYDSSSGSKRYGYKGTCKCKETSIWYNPSRKCLPKATKLGDSCEVSDQCRDGTLGKLSICDRDTAKCICMSVSGALNNAGTVYYERTRKCFVKKEYFYTCSDNDECRANLGPDVKCGTTEYSDKNVCHCPQGRVCRSGQSSTFSGVKLFAGIAIITIAIVVVCLVIYFCCRGCIGAKGRNKNGPVIQSTAIAIPKNHNKGSGPPVKENDPAAKSLRQPQQPVEYALPLQPKNFGYPLTSGPHPQDDPKRFEISRLYPRLPDDTELSSFP